MNPIQQKPMPATPTIEECSICFENAEMRVRTKCSHVFHQTCLDKWLTTPGSNGRCAICRFTLTQPVPGHLAEDLDLPEDSDTEEEAESDDDEVIDNRLPSSDLTIRSFRNPELAYRSCTAA
jgi:hypothetical protein